MKRLLFLVMLGVLPTSCGDSFPPPVTPRPIAKCKVPTAYPIPELKPWVCEDGSAVCLSPDDVVELSRWAFYVSEVETALAACSLVERV